MTRVLLADDDPFMRRLAEIALKREGFVVTTVADGTEALESLQAEAVDVVILDGMMPMLDGVETCRRLKAEPRTAHIPVIMLSARTAKSEQEEGLAAGAAGYITKPFDLPRLGNQVRGIVARQAVETASQPGGHDIA
jgi:DNA-binding response OmpR family regulator